MASSNTIESKNCTEANQDDHISRKELITYLEGYSKFWEREIEKEEKAGKDASYGEGAFCEIGCILDDIRKGDLSPPEVL